MVEDNTRGASQPSGVAPATDTFRKEYKPLTEGQIEMVQKIKAKAEELEALLNDANNPNIGRYIALAKTNLEQAVMWAVKGVTT